MFPFLVFVFTLSLCMVMLLLELKKDGQILKCYIFLSLFIYIFSNMSRTKFMSSNDFNDNSLSLALTFITTFFSSFCKPFKILIIYFSLRDDFLPFLSSCFYCKYLKIKYTISCFTFWNNWCTFFSI